MSTKSTKGLRAKYSNFIKWNLQGSFGYKTVNEGGTDYVNFVWCKVCAKHSQNKSLKATQVRGASEVSSENFIQGTSFITKHTVS